MTDYPLTSFSYLTSFTSMGHNFRYWSVSPPKWHREQSLNSRRVSVWRATRKGGVFGPFFFENKVNGTNYLKMLQEFIVPYLREQNINHKIRFQDGAPPHWSGEVRSFLDITFPPGWIGRSSSSSRGLSVVWTRVLAIFPLKNDQGYSRREQTTITGRAEEKI